MSYHELKAAHYNGFLPAIISDGNGSFTLCPELMTEAELIRFLRIPEISRSKDPHNVIEQLKRFRALPRIRVCNKCLYPLQGVLQWIEEETRYAQ